MFSRGTFLYTDLSHVPLLKLNLSTIINLPKLSVATLLKPKSRFKCQPKSQLISMIYLADKRVVELATLIR